MKYFTVFKDKYGVLANKGTLSSLLKCCYLNRDKSQSNTAELIFHECISRFNISVDDQIKSCLDKCFDDAKANELMTYANQEISKRGSGCATQQKSCCKRRSYGNGKGKSYKPRSSPKPRKKSSLFDGKCPLGGKFGSSKSCKNRSNDDPKSQLKVDGQVS